MSRVLPVLFAALMLVGLFFVPEADSARLAALDVGSLLDVPQPGPDGSERDTATAIFERAGQRSGDNGGYELVLGELGLESPGAGDPPALDALARRTLISALRQRADKRGRALFVDGELAPTAGGSRVRIVLSQDALALVYEPPGAAPIEARLPGWRAPRPSSLFPPMIAIVLAVLFRRPVLSLFAGVWCAAWLLRRADGGGGVVADAFGSLADVGTEMFWPQLVDPYRLQIMGFVFAMLSMVGVMTKSGGIRGLMDLVAGLARDARRTQIATWLMGLIVFFDDYANCILVGSTMRPLSDRYRIAREKLAFLVDCTAAPVAGLSIFSTWIAFEVSTFSAQLPAAGLSPSAGYGVFVETLPYRFYCLLTLFLGGLIAFSGRDFGPMLTAERRARSTGKLVRPGGKPMVSEAATALEPHEGIEPRAVRALLPLAVFIGLTLFEILRVGMAAVRASRPQFGFSDLLTLQGITAVLGDGDSTRAILVGSVSALVVAVLLSLAAGMGTVVVRAAWTTLRSMGVAIAILYLAWMIGAACDALRTAPYLTGLIGDSMTPALLPTILFLGGALVAFSTGSSWSTMSILLPLVVGLAYNLGAGAPIGGHALMVICIGAVLEGSIFGDHCSPISDTTVLSSTASASDHIDHVRTQAPYAIVTMLVALCAGYLPAAFGQVHPALSLLTGAAVLLMIVFVFGRKSDAALAPADAP